MGFDISISDRSLASSPHAACSRLRREVFAYVVKNEDMPIGRYSVRTINVGLQHFHFVNPPPTLPLEPTENCWAYQYCYHPIDAANSLTKVNASRDTGERRAEFLGFLTRDEFIAGSQASDVTVTEYHWDALAYELGPGIGNYTGERQRQICAKCSVRDILWDECQPRLFGAGDIQSFLDGLSLVVTAALHDKGEYRIAFDRLVVALDLLGRPELDSRFTEALSFYNAVISKIKREGYLVLLGTHKLITLDQDVLVQRLFAALFLRDMSQAYTQAELEQLTSLLRLLLDFTDDLLKDGGETARMRALLDFRSRYEIMVRALCMAQLHQLEMSISY